MTNNTSKTKFRAFLPYWSYRISKGNNYNA